MSQITVLGAGSWGTALAVHLSRGGHEVTLWNRKPEVLQDIEQNQQNTKYFPGRKVNAPLRIEKDILKATAKARVLVVSVPSSAVREVLHQIRQSLNVDTLLVNTAKGLDVSTLQTMNEVMEEELGPDMRKAVLGGPSFALEVLEGRPTAVSMAAANASLAEEAGRLFHHKKFRVYSSTDIIGVELGGVMKNVIAIASGISDGLGLGHNARAAIMTRGLAEMQRVVAALGGEPLTVSGLSGLGDLLLTATGDLSRNRRVGLGLGQGKKLPEILEELGQVAEGVKNALSVRALGKKHNVEVPITEEVAQVIEGKTSVQDSIDNLLSRAFRAEVGE